MKIIHKKKKKISSMQFSSPKQKYKKYSFFPPHTHLQTTGEGVQCCALKGCFPLLSEGFMSLKDPGCPDLWPKK